MNKQKQPQEGDPLTAKEFFNQYMVARQNYPLEAWASELAERYADYQTAALRDDFRQMMERRDHWKKEAELLREELEVIKARNEGLEQEKQEYIDKYNLAISELEAVKKEKVDLSSIADQLRKDYERMERYGKEKAKQLSEMTRQRDEANELLREFRSRATHGNIQDLVDFDEKVQLHLSRLSSGETKPVNKCWENDNPKPCTELQIKAGQCACNPNHPEIPDSSKPVSPWISVEEQPIIEKTSFGWQTTGAGGKDFLAAVPYKDKKQPGEVLWWIRHCVIEDEHGLCVVGDDENEPAGWSFEDILYYQIIPAPPESLTDKTE